MDLDEALAVALGGAQHPIDAGRVNGSGPTGWLLLLLRRPAHSGICRIQFTELRVTLDQEQLWERDGEVMGSARQLTVVAQPGALLLRMPPEPA
jgi:hypothetical protein